MTYALSPSSLNLLEECPRCFYLQVVKKIRRPSGPMSSIPIKMDSIIKKYFSTYREKGILPPLIEGKIKGVLPLDMPKTLYYEDKENDIKLKGLPDEYLQTEDGLIVPFDHKTKSKAPEETHSSYQLQLDCYTFLLETNGYKTENFGYLAYYHPEQCELHNGMDVQVTIIKVKTDPERVRKVLKKASEILNGKLPRVNGACEYCKWKKLKI
ncbi:PD-(D/E)XK nuclease family protein [Candidatus Pacearchaeota archaeon]|nr:PD-(D/E)XK nuclease family protein [Candidatus Pacearchaeota archaeon]